MTKSYQSSKYTEELYNICVSNRIKTTKQCVKNSNCSANDDWNGISNFQNDTKSWSWKTLVVCRLSLFEIDLKSNVWNIFKLQFEESSSVNQVKQNKKLIILGNFCCLELRFLHATYYILINLWLEINYFLSN